MSRRCVSLVTALAMLFAPAVFAADLQVTPPSCVSAAQNPRVVASLPSNAATARVYLKAHGQSNDYYVYMHKTAAGWVAMLPKPLASTSAVDYRIVAADGNGVQTSSAVLSTTVAPSCPAQQLTADDQASAENVVLGLTGSQQSAVPPGFQCNGIVSYIAVNGDMKSNDECRRLVAAAATSGSAAGVPATATGAGATGAGATGAGATGAGATGAGATGAGATGAAATGAGATGAGAAGAGAAGGAAGGGLSAATITALSVAGAVALGVGIYENNKSTKKTSPSNP